MPRQGHNTPFPLKRSPPAGFKRLLGGRVRKACLWAAATALTALSGCYSEAVRISVIVRDKELSLTIVALSDL